MTEYNRYNVKILKYILNFRTIFFKLNKLQVINILQTFNSWNNSRRIFIKSKLKIRHNIKC